MDNQSYQLQELHCGWIKYFYASLHEVRVDFDAGDGGRVGEGGGAVEDRAQPAADVQHLNKGLGDESRFGAEKNRAIETKSISGI